MEIILKARYKWKQKRAPLEPIPVLANHERAEEELYTLAELRAIWNSFRIVEPYIPPPPPPPKITRHNRMNFKPKKSDRKK